MESVEIWRSGGAKAMMALEDGVLSIAYVGRLSGLAWSEVADIADGLAGNEAIVLLVDFRQAGMRTAECEVGGGQPVRTALTRRSLPGVLIVPAAHLVAYKGFAGELAKTGIERAIFTSASQGCAYALEMRETQRSLRQQFSTLARRAQPTVQLLLPGSQPRTRRSSWQPTPR